MRRKQKRGEKNKELTAEIALRAQEKKLKKLCELCDLCCKNKN